jgi:hypothetical protein
MISTVGQPCNISKHRMVAVDITASVLCINRARNQLRKVRGRGAMMSEFALSCPTACDTIFGSNVACSCFTLGLLAQCFTFGAPLGRRGAFSGAITHTPQARGGPTMLSLDPKSGHSVSPDPVGFGLLAMTNLKHVTFIHIWS